MRKSYKLYNHESCNANVEIHFDENNHANKIELWSYETRICGAYRTPNDGWTVFARALIRPRPAVKFRGFLASLGSPRALGNCLIICLRLSAKNAIGALGTRPMKNPSAFPI